MAKVNEETGEVEFEEADWEREDNPYVKRFNDYRSGADRIATSYKQQEELLQGLQSEDPAVQRSAAEQLGLTFVEDEPAAGEDPVAGQLSEMEKRLAAYEQREQQREQQAEQAALASRVDSKLEAMGLDQEDGDWVLARAIALEPLEDGMPDLEGAHKQLQERDEKRFENWRSTKRAPQVRRGQTATEQKNIADMTDEERLEYVLQKHNMD